MPLRVKCELISQLHILASLQARDCKQQGYDLTTAHQAIREYSVCWLYGAAAELSRANGRSSGELDALGVISTLTRQASSLACFRSGIEGAELWRTHHFIPREQSLFRAITSNTFV